MLKWWKIIFLQGIPLENIKIAEVAAKAWEAAENGQLDGLVEKFEPMFEEMGKDIVRQRKRLGGDWAIAMAVFTRVQREFLRKVIGPDLVFIVLQMTKDCQKKRLLARHGTDDPSTEEFVKVLNDIYDLYDSAEDDEENAYNIMITEDMSIDDVMEKVLEIVNKI